MVIIDYLKVITILKRIDVHQSRNLNFGEYKAHLLPRAHIPYRLALLEVTQAPPTLVAILLKVRD